MDNKNKHKELKKPPVPVKDTSHAVLQDEKYDEAIYPTGWDFEEFKNLPSFAARVKYVTRNLGKLGAGSSRLVFDIDPQTVFKLAKNTLK